MNINNSLRQTPVAVIGLSAIFAEARNIEEFWSNIVAGKDSITDVPASRWNIDDYYDPDVTAPDKTYCKRGGFLPDIDFNPMEFGLPPNILEVTDASQLLALVAARDALKDAGYGKESVKFSTALKAKTGVILGVGGGQKLITPLTSRLQYPIWERALRASGIAEEDIPPIVDKMKKAYIGWNENSFPGMLGNVISGRITNRFDLGGINSVVDAACAASLSAIKMSLSELVEGRCDMMLTGGVDTDNSPFMYMSFSKTPAFSKAGQIRPFDANADGMLIGEGVGMLVLKRLADAERDGDRIYGVIKGVGTSSDGRFKSVYAPRSSGQALAMNRAYKEAGYEPSTVGLIEAHGTGTGAGDPTEFQSIKTVFSKENTKPTTALGSVKSQIGHTKAAAGAAGIIKTVLALHHKILPPTINVEQPNPKLDIQNSSIYLNTETRPWIRNGHPRRAGVSAFGFGGINVHLTLEEYQTEHESTYRIHQPYKSVLLHAPSPGALLQTIQQQLNQLQSEHAEVAFTKLLELAADTIPAPHARLGFVTASIEACIASLELALQTLQQNQDEWNHPKGIYFRPAAIPAGTKTVALFSGQGSQYPNMGKELLCAFPSLRETFTQVDHLFAKDGKEALSEKVYPVPVFSTEEKAQQKTTLTDTKNAQPAIGTLSMGLYKLLAQAGFQPDFCAGHSFGELTALWAAGVYNEETFLALAKARGEAMSIKSNGRDTGTMLAVKASYEQVVQELPHLTNVTIANVNSSNQIVLGGGRLLIEEASKRLQAKGFSVVPLPVSAAFHTAYVQHAQRPFAEFIANQEFQTPQLPVYSNTTAKPYPTNPGAIKSTLENQILQPVWFKQQIEQMFVDGARVFVEFGPKGVLTNLVKDILKGQPHYAIALNPKSKLDSDLQFRQAVVQLQVLGLPIQNIDPFKVSSVEPAAKTKLSVQLGGHNYVSSQTQQAYTDALNDGFQVKGGGPLIEKEVEKMIEVPVEKIVEKVITPKSEEAVMNQELTQLFKSTLEHFKAHQTKSLEVFERFLSEQNQQMQLLLSMLNQQIGTPTTTPVEVPITSNGNGHHAQVVAPPVVEQPQVSYSNGTPPVVTMPTPPAVAPQPQVQATAPQVQVQVQPQPQPKPQPQVAAPSNGVSQDKLASILLDVISEKTGYPAEMLELSMDMEADLGIDSIKRVEIFGSLTDKYPEMSGINPQELTELRTLQQIVDFIAQKGVSAPSIITQTSAPVAKPTPAAPAPVATPAPTAVPSNGTGLDQAQLSKILLDVVSEKTGYPAEMLELSMDMEADLGIDSIKRVEIFGAITEQYPEVTGINPQELTELRTLGQIVDYIAEKGKKKQLA